MLVKQFQHIDAGRAIYCATDGSHSFRLRAVLQSPVEGHTAIDKLRNILGIVCCLHFV